MLVALCFAAVDPSAQVTADQLSSQYSALLDRLQSGAPPTASTTLSPIALGWKQFGEGQQSAWQALGQKLDAKNKVATPGLGAQAGMPVTQGQVDDATNKAWNDFAEGTAGFWANLSSNMLSAAVAGGGDASAPVAPAEQTTASMEDSKPADMPTPFPADLPIAGLVSQTEAPPQVDATQAGWQAFGAAQGAAWSAVGNSTGEWFNPSSSNTKWAEDATAGAWKMFSDGEKAYWSGLAARLSDTKPNQVVDDIAALKSHLGSWMNDYWMEFNSSETQYWTQATALSATLWSGMGAFPSSHAPAALAASPTGATEAASSVAAGGAAGTGAPIQQQWWPDAGTAQQQWWSGSGTPATQFWGGGQSLPGSEFWAPQPPVHV
mmetsp:Transcript_89121/g.238721  ORF Transcript_89121/g.238721 Transcript_89121/m.238721 type:complete len:378 (+) Transcript_89121:35-1168(+)